MLHWVTGLFMILVRQLAGHADERFAPNVIQTSFGAIHDFLSHRRGNLFAKSY